MKSKIRFKFFFSLSHRIILQIVLTCFIFSCTNKKVDSDYFGYPKKVGELIIPNCANAGCHNATSKEAASGLDLSSWDKLFEGGRNNVSVIPFAPDQSFLLFFLNSYSDLGPVILPTMPYGGKPFSREQFQLIQSWIREGAPNSKGEIKFDGIPDRKKIYVTNQGCDLVTVFDLETELTMRYVKIGNNLNSELPHSIKLSPDGKYWYVIFTNGNSIQRFDAETDTYSGELIIGPGNWNTFAISADGKMGFAVNWAAQGSVTVVNLENMTVIQEYKGSGLFEWPHGSYVSKDNNTLYVTAQFGNFIYKIDITDILQPDIEKISMETGIPPTSSSKLDIHEILFTPDESIYFISCQNSNEIRALSAKNDSLLTIIKCGVFPQELALSKCFGYLFATCTEDTLNFPGKRGSVTVIDYKNLSFIKHLYSGHQPHGIAVSEHNNRVYIANRNASVDGFAPHHTGGCSGRNGFVTILDINTLSILKGYKAEVSIDPYSVAVRE